MPSVPPHTHTFEIETAEIADITAGTSDLVVTSDVIKPFLDNKIDLDGGNVADLAALRAALGLEIGADVQAYDADLSAIGALAKTDGNVIFGNGTTWVAESGATARASLGLGSAAVAALIDDDTMATATDTNVPSGESVKAYADTKQPLNANLTTLAAETAGTVANIVGQGAYLAEFEDVPTLLADNTLDYGAAANQAATGKLIRTRKEGYTYEIAASGASDEDLETAGGVKLYVLPEKDGSYNVGAWGPTTGDQTALVIAAGVKAGPIGVVRVPGGVEYNPTTALADANWPLQVVLFDAGLRETGYSNARTYGGPYEKGDPSAARDVIHVIAHSGHNPTALLSNDGSSGSGSGDARVVTLGWAGGWHEKGAISGFPRSFAVQQFSNDIANSRWTYAIRKRAPSIAIDALYFRWEEGVAVTTGEVCFAGSGTNRYYQAASTGTTGATAPSHTTGTVSDGGVDWTAITFSYDGTIFAIDDLGRIAANAAFLAGAFQRYKLSADDPATSIVAIWEATGNSKSASLQLRATDSGGTVTDGWSMTASDTAFSFIRNGVTLGGFDSSGFVQRLITKPHSNVTAAGGSVTPSVISIGTLYLGAGSATDLTGLTNGVANQEVAIIAGSNDWTLIHSASFQLTGGVDAVLTAGSVVTMRRWPGSGSSWIEVSRSIK